MASPVGGTALAHGKRKQLKKNLKKDEGLLKSYGTDAERARTYLSSTSKYHQRTKKPGNNVFSKAYKTVGNIITGRD